MITAPKTIFQQKLKENLKSSINKNIVYDLIKLHLFKNSEKDANQLVLVELYNLLGVEKFINFITMFSGVSLNLPKKEDLKDTIIISLCYYYKEIEGKNWDEIKSLLNIPDLSSIKYGIKLGQLNDFIKTQLTILGKKDNE